MQDIPSLLAHVLQSGRSSIQFEVLVASCVYPLEHEHKPNLIVKKIPEARVA
jgi:hypothetical protein